MTNITGAGQTLATTGNLKVQPERTTTYTLTAYNEAGESASASTTITVKQPLPIILAFRAEPAQIVKGAVSTLSWRTENAARVVLTNTASNQALEVAGDGSLKVQPEKTTTYTLSVFNESGDIATSMVTVDVLPSS